MSGGLRPRVRVRTFVVSAALLTLVAAPQASGRTLSEALEARGIRDPRVLAAFDQVSREQFGSPGGADLLTLARLADGLGVPDDSKVLVVGGTSGYPAALMAATLGSVFVVIPGDEEARTVRLRLSEAEYRNVHVKRGAARDGWREYGPYDAVLVATPEPGVYQPLIEQLREGGVLVIATREPSGKQTLLRGVKRGFKLRARALASSPALSGAPAVPEAKPPPPRVERRPEVETDAPDPPDARSRDVHEPDAPDSDRPTADE